MPNFSTAILCANNSFADKLAMKAAIFGSSVVVVVGVVVGVVAGFDVVDFVVADKSSVDFAADFEKNSFIEL